VRAALDSIAQKSGEKIYVNLRDVACLDVFCETPDKWAATTLGNSARIAEDINSSWQTVQHDIDDARTVAPAYNLPGFFGDLDSLEIGNCGFGANEKKALRSIWAIMSR
jgi:hypothetical protein